MQGEHYRGSAAELFAARYYLQNEVQVYWPQVQQGPVDFIIDDGSLKKVQVKCAYYNTSGGRKYLQCTTGKTTEYDILFIVGDDCHWIIPSDKLDSTNISLLPSQKNKMCRWDSYKTETH